MLTGRVSNHVSPEAAIDFLIAVRTDHDVVDLRSEPFQTVLDEGQGVDSNQPFVH